MYENGTNIGNAPECPECESYEQENARLRKRLAAMTAWLETNQPDVFRRGIWDAVEREGRAVT